MKTTEIYCIKSNACYCNRCIMKSIKSETETIGYPSNWKTGFEKGRYRIACGGTEVPCFHKGFGWVLLVWDTKIKKHFFYIYKFDRIEEFVTF